MADDDELMQSLERDSRQRTERVRQILREEGRLDILADFDRNMRDLALGVTGARSCWHSISPAQRRVLTLLTDSPRKLRRSPGTVHFYDAIGEPFAIGRVAGLKTVRALAARELLEWNGGAFDPEKTATLTERGRFVTKIASLPTQGPLT